MILLDISSLSRARSAFTSHIQNVQNAHPLHRLWMLISFFCIPTFYLLWNHRVTSALHSDKYRYLRAFHHVEAVLMMAISYLFYFDQFILSAPFSFFSFVSMPIFALVNCWSSWFFLLIQSHFEWIIAHIWRQNGRHSNRS